MTINLGATANPLEWAYTGCALITLLVTLTLTVQAWADRRIQREVTIRNGSARNRVALRIARGQVEDLVYMALVMLAIVAMGVDAMLTPPTNPAKPITSLAWVFAVGLISINLTCFLKALRAYMRRRLALREIEISLDSWDGLERRDDSPLSRIATSVLKAELARRESVQDF